MARKVVIHLEPGTPRLGIWCDRCLTSAVCEVDLYMFGPTNEAPSIISTFRRCVRCDGER